MKFVSFDVETGGFKPDINSLLSAAFVVEDTDKPGVPVRDLPHAHVIIQHEIIHAHPAALCINARLIERIHQSRKWRTRTLANLIEDPGWFDAPLVNVDADGTIAARPEDFPLVIEQLLRKLAGPPIYTAAGKNYASFDRDFLPPPVARLFRHRVLDLGSMFINWSDPHLADLATIKTRLGLDGEVAHDALEDARDVIRCIRLAPGYPR